MQHLQISLMKSNAKGRLGKSIHGSTRWKRQESCGTCISQMQASLDTLREGSPERRQHQIGSPSVGEPKLNSLGVSRWRADSVVVLSDGSLHTGEVPLFGQEYFSQGLTYFCLTGASEGAGDQIGWVRTV